MKKHLITLFVCISVFVINAQSVLKPGFDKSEYTEMLKITARQIDLPWTDSSVHLPYPDAYKFVYRSPVMGLDNLWDLWIDGANKKAVLSIRGTTANATSWLANFYSAMVPAKGNLQISKDFNFEYDVAKNPKSAVHIGWLIGTAYLSKDIIPKVDSLYNSGIKDFIIMGHSQGGGIGYLLTSHLLSLKEKGKLPKDIIFKTYCSAAPKPGNLYFAYDYEYQTRGGWAFNVVNTADWVPETPFSIQTLNDFNTINPFTDAKKILNTQKQPQRFVLKTVYRKLEKHPRKALKQFKKYLGGKAYGLTTKTLADFKEPDYYNSNNYMRAGVFIILSPDDAYYNIYKDDKTKVFNHHFPEPYYYLIQKYSE
jgi:hypothetical protein